MTQHVGGTIHLEDRCKDLTVQTVIMTNSQGKL